MRANPWGIKMLFLSRCCSKKKGGIVGLSPCRETCSNSSFSFNSLSIWENWLRNWLVRAACEDELIWIYVNNHLWSVLDKLRLSWPIGPCNWCASVLRLLRFLSEGCAVVRPLALWHAQKCQGFMFLRKEVIAVSPRYDTSQIRLPFTSDKT